MYMFTREEKREMERKRKVEREIEIKRLRNSVREK